MAHVKDGTLNATDQGPGSTSAAPDDPGWPLRLRAEAALDGAGPALTQQAEAQLPDAAQQTLHELRVHQIELQMQNEELRRILAELDRSQAKYFDFYDMAPVGYCTVGAQGLILEANLTSASLLGLSRSALLKNHFSRFIHSEDQDIFYALRQQIIASGEARTCELRLIKADGMTLWIRLNAMPVPSNGGPPALRIVLSEISEQILAKAALRQSKHFKQTILDSISDEIVVLDHAGMVLAVNRAWQVFGLNNGAVADNPTAGITPGANYLKVCDAQSLAGIEGVMQGRLPSFTLEYPCHGPQQQRWFSMKVTPMGDATFGSVVIVHAEITSRMRLEQERGEALVLLQKIANRVPGLVYKYELRPDGSSSFPYASEAIREIYRVSPHEVREDAAKVFARLHPDDLARVIASIAQSARDLSPWTQEYRVRFDDGTVRWLQGNALAQREADGATLWHGFITDVTERKQAEEELTAHRAEAALGESRQRLRELVAQNEKAREDERKHVAREIHDELGQVLTALRMNLLLMEMRFCALDPALADVVLDMKTLVDRAIHGVRGVALNLRPQALDLGLVSAIEWLREEFSKRTDLPCVLHVQDEAIDLDETRSVVVFRIVQESLTNVARYARASRVDIDLCHRGDELQVQVRDDGRGFDVALARTKKSFGLLGMRERANVLGGRLDIHSAIGQGTTVSVVIPLAFADKGEDS
jgi:PAS domain S-box-containing protein